MSNIILGNNSNLQFKVGSGDCSIYLGTTLLYPQTPPTPHDYSLDYLTFVAETDGVYFLYASDLVTNSLQYSIDSGNTWSGLSHNRATVLCNNGDKVLFKASGLSINNEAGIGRIIPSGAARVEGNTMSLLYGDNFSGQTTISNSFQLRKLFSGATNLTSAENLVLPSTTITKQCYSQMFQGCTSLAKAPKAIGTSATTFGGDYSCSDMFNGCTSLVTVSSGLLPMTSLYNQCYWYMFQGCTSLTNAPDLPAINLSSQCYQGMFNGCTSLNYIKAMTTTALGAGYTRDWVTSVPSGGTFVKNSAATWTDSFGNNAIPNGWTVTTASA